MTTRERIAAIDPGATYTVKQVAAIFDRPYGTVYTWITRKKLLTTEPNIGSGIRVSGEQILAALALKGFAIREPPPAPATTGADDLLELQRMQ